MIGLGSEYDIDLSRLTIRNNNIFAYLSKYKSNWFDSGRSAIRHLYRTLSTNGEVLLPEFICESVIKCFDVDRIKFYKINDDFSIDIDSLNSKVNEKTKIVFLMHYFGKVQPESILCKIKELANDNELLIIEDTTHSIFSKTATIGDYQVCSIRKWLPTAGAGVLYSIQDKKNILSGAHYQKSSDNRRIYGMLLKNMYINGQLDCNEEYRRIFHECDILLARRENICNVSDLSRFLLECEDVYEVRLARIQNYKLLESMLNEMGILSAISLTDKECPLVLPVKVKNRDAFRSFLIENRIYCAVHWPFDGLEIEQRTNSKKMSERLISLPIDQRYGEKEMHYLAEMIELFFKKGDEL